MELCFIPFVATKYLKVHKGKSSIVPKIKKRKDQKKKIEKHKIQSGIQRYEKLIEMYNMAHNIRGWQFSVQ